MIKAKIMMEVAGFPKEHVEKTVKALEKEIPKKGYNVEEFEALPIEEKEKMFSGVMDLTVNFDEIVKLYTFCFDFMPSSIDILEPEKLTVHARDFNHSLNDLMATLHNHDAFLKNSNAKIKVLTSNLDYLLVNFIKSLSEKGATIEEMSKKTGIDSEKLKNVLKQLIEKDVLKKEGDKYLKNE